MFSFTNGVEPVCGLLCGTFTYKNEDMCVEKTINIYRIKQNYIYTSEEHNISIKQINNFIKSINTNTVDKLTLVADDNFFESISYENNKIYFKSSVDLSNFNFSFEVNEINKESVLNTFNDFLNWCNTIILNENTFTK